MMPSPAQKRKVSHLNETSAGSESEVTSPRKQRRTASESSGPPWTIEECQELLSKLSEQKSMLQHDYRRALKYVKWESIKIGNHDANSVRGMTDKLINQVRKYRTLDEVLTDCKEKVDSEGFGKVLLDFPKRPLMPFSDYFSRHCTSIKETNPGAKSGDFLRIASEQYKKLPDKKKEKYLMRYKDRKENFDEQMNQLRREHPECFSEKKKKSSKKSKTKEVELVKKPIQAKQNYLKTQVEGKLKKHPEKSRDSLMMKFTKKWNKMTEEEKEPWLVLAVDDKLRYLEELTALRGDSRIAEADLSNLINKAQLRKREAQLKLVYMGWPKPPPQSGYQNFMASKLARNNEDDEGGEKKMSELMSSAVREWKEMSEAKKEKVKAKAKKKGEAYKQKYAEWKESLSASDALLAGELENIITRVTRKESVKTPKKANGSSKGVNKAKSRLTFLTEAESEKQTTITQHFSPKLKLSDSDDKSTKDENGEDSDSYHSPNVFSEDECEVPRSLDDFDMGKIVKPRPGIHAKSPPKQNVRLTPTLMSPMVYTPTKKLGKKA